MSASDRPGFALIFMLVAFSAGCDDSRRILIPPEAPAELAIVAALDPGSAFQSVFVQAPGGGRPPFPVVARVLRDDAVVAQETVDEADGGDPGSCASGFGNLTRGGGVCLQLPLWPEEGVEYVIEVEAPGRKLAWARTTVLGAFDLDDAVVAGEPPDHVAVSWSRSAGAHQYVLSVRAGDPSCIPCATGWATYMDSTRYDGPVDATSLAEGAAPWVVQVQAMNQDFYDFLTTGATGDVFTVPPRQNVVDGYGVFGSRARSQIEAGQLAADLRRGPWELRGLPGPDLRTLRIDPGDGDVLWVAGAAGVLRSGNGGGLWTRDLEGPELTPASMSVGSDGTVLMGRGNELLQRDPISGVWSVAATFDAPVRATLQAAGVAWAVAAEAGGTVTQVHRTDGDGSLAPTGPWREVGELDLAPRSPSDLVKLVRDSASSVLWLGLREAAPLMRSDDGGETWEHLVPPPGLLEDLVALPSGRLYAGVRGIADGIRTSRDGGRTWTTGTETPTAALAAHADRPDQVWIAEQALPLDGSHRPRLRILRSDAAGANAEPTGFGGGDTRALAVDPTGSWVYLLVGVSSFDLPFLTTTAVLRLPIG